MRAKLLKKFGNSALILLTIPNELQRVYIVDSIVVEGMRVEEEFEISENAVIAGTEYSIDWEIIIPKGFHIPAAKIHQALISRGIYTPADFRNNQKVVNDAITVLVGEFRIQLYKLVEEMLG